MALRSSLWTCAFFGFYWAISFFMAHHQHQRISCENQSRTSAPRKGGGGAECGPSLGFHFQSPFPPLRTRTCLNLLPDVIKGMEPVESRAGVLSTRWYSPPRPFFFFISPLNLPHTFTQALKPLNRTEQIHFSTLSCLSQIKIYLHFRALYEIWQIAHS